MPVSRSRPVRARGLKQQVELWVHACKQVAPRAGAWIETRSPAKPLGPALSRPVRARGLKHHTKQSRRTSYAVAPRAGAWIETPIRPNTTQAASGRAPCGRVD